MSSDTSKNTQNQVGRKTTKLADRVEESLISGLLGLMTLITFANVVARYGFSSNILWSLELTVFLFGWLVLLGASYAVRQQAHLGVDAILVLLKPSKRRIFAIISAMACLVFSVLLFKGAWDYWANFANLPGTTGRWFPLGFEVTYREKGWYEVNDIPMPEMLRWMEQIFNEGEAYEKIPRFLPYAVLPISTALLLYRYLQVTRKVWQGRVDRIIASHECNEELEHLNAKSLNSGSSGAS